MKATGVTAGLAESNGSLLPGLWRDSLHTTCGLTACTPGSAPGPTLGNEYGKTLSFTFFSQTAISCRMVVPPGKSPLSVFSRFLALSVGNCSHLNALPVSIKHKLSHVFYAVLSLVHAHCSPAPTRRLGDNRDISCNRVSRDMKTSTALAVIAHHDVVWQDTDNGASTVLWNSLPLTVRDSSLTLTQFCTRLKTFLFTRAYGTSA